MATIRIDLAGGTIYVDGQRVQAEITSGGIVIHVDKLARDDLRGYEGGTTGTFGGTVRLAIVDGGTQSLASLLAASPLTFDVTPATERRFFAIEIRGRRSATWANAPLRVQAFARSAIATPLRRPQARACQLQARRWKRRRWLQQLRQEIRA